MHLVEVMQLVVLVAIGFTVAVPWHLYARVDFWCASILAACSATLVAFVTAQILPSVFDVSQDDLILGFTLEWPVACACGVFRLLRRRARPDAGVCDRCGYNLYGLSSSRCPECGSPFSDRAIRPPAQQRCRKPAGQILMQGIFAGVTFSSAALLSAGRVFSGPIYTADSLLLWFAFGVGCAVTMSLGYFAWHRITIVICVSLVLVLTSSMVVWWHLFA